MNATLRNILLASSLFAGLTFAPVINSQIQRPTHTNNRPGSGNNGNHNGNRPGSGNNGNHNGNRPGSGNNSSHNGNRPGSGNNGSHNGNRPGSSHNGNRPGNNGSHNGNRPGSGNNGSHNGNRPGVPSRPNHNSGNINHWPGDRHGNGWHPGHNSPAPGNWSRPVPPPHRAYRPISRPIPRPVRPHGYCPHHGAPVISTVLGLTFGTLYNSTLDYLYYKGYEIDGYVDNTIYLRNVREMAYTWPDATMYYDAYGHLTGAQFIYSTSYNALGRYDRLYHNLCLTYGTPVSSRWNGHHREMMWYGGDSRGYVTLEYDYSAGRYYTILSYGV